MSSRLTDRVKARLARPERVFVTPGGSELADWCREHPGSAVEVVVSARALHELLCEPGLPLADLAAVRAYAEAQFGHYFGAAAQRFLIAPWQLGDAAGASALQGIDLAVPAGVRLHAVRPAWSVWLAALPAALRSGSGRLVWLEGTVAVVIALERGRIAALQSRRVETLADLGGDAALAVGTPESDLAPQPGPAVPAPDFLPARTRSPLAWPLAATGALVLALAAWGALQSRQALADAQATRDRVVALRPGLPTSAPAQSDRAARTARRPAAEPENRAAIEARALLAAPWEATLTRVETAGADAKTIAWLGLDATAARGELRLEGLTPDKLVALQLAEQLGRTPGWQAVVLSRFTAAETGLVGQRFEIGARVHAAATAGGGS
jgi:hypothetical protein